MLENVFRGASIAMLGTALLLPGETHAQTPPPVAPAVPPNAETPPGGVPRGVVPPPAVDPGMVTPPPQDTTPTMPIIKPPDAAR